MIIKRSLAILLLIVLIISIPLNVEKVEAAPAIIIPASALVPIVAKILITAGVTAVTVEGLKALSSQCINDMDYSTLQNLKAMALHIVDGGVFVTSTVWTFVKHWIDTRINVGANTVPYTSSGTWENGMIYDKSATVYFVKGGETFNLRLKLNPTDNKYYVAINNVIMTNSYSITADIYNEYTGLEVEWSSSTPHALWLSLHKLVGSTNSFRVISVQTNGSYYVDSILYGTTAATMAVTGVDGITDNPDYIHANSVTGQNTFLVNQSYADLITTNPSAITDADINAAILDYPSISADNVIAEQVPMLEGVDAPPIVDVTGIEAVLDGIFTKIGDIGTTITDTITTGVQTITSTITSTQTGTPDETIEDNPDIPTIFEFFISLLNILKHLILIVIKFLMFILVIRQIPAQSSLFNENTKLVIDYIHNHDLPIFGLSFMDIINGFVGIFVAIQIIKIINKNVRSNT